MADRWRPWFCALACAVLAPAAQAQWFGGAKSEITAQFDRNGDGWLNPEELQAARNATRGGTTGRRGRRQFDDDGAPPTAGQALTPANVRLYQSEPLYELSVLRTVFITFPMRDWEQELSDFYRTDVDVPATVSVDGRTYHNVGVHFRGNTSYQMVSAGRKRSMDLKFDLADEAQKLLGYRKIELLNSAADPTFLRTALYMHIMREYLPAPLVNYLRVVINGESWGVYVNLEHLSGDMTQRITGSKTSARWKIPGSPRGRGGLEYLGEDPDVYRSVYEIKSDDKPKSWRELIKLCRVLNNTPIDQLQTALAPLLDVDGTLRFLAVEKALINNDGYWTRASDYSLYTDASGRFHVTPHDANETIRPTEGMMWGSFGDPAGSAADSVELDPLAGASDPGKPLLYRLLQVPALRAKYLAYVRDVADKWLDWERLGPLAARYQSVIAADVARDTRKLFTTESFTSATTADGRLESYGGPIGAPDISMKAFATERRAYLLRRVPATRPRASRAPG
jgi:CotH kinase protein